MTMPTMTADSLQTQSRSGALPLADLGPQECAVMRSADLSETDRELLASMGLRENCRLRLCRVGEPCIVQVEATRLGLSRQVSGRILVERCAAGA